jgi:hypothetical protein
MRADRIRLTVAASDAYNDLGPALGLGIIWIVVAALADGATFHLAPLIVAAAPVVRHPDRPKKAALGGMLTSLQVAVAPSMAGFMGGPTLLPTGGALLESVVVAVTGALVALKVVSRIPMREARTST